MKTAITHPSETKVMLTISVTADELKQSELVALNHLAKTVKVPGFRKGKVPVSVVAKHVDGATLQQETLDHALSKAVSEAFLAEKLQVLSRPEVEIKKFVPGSELEFTAEADIVPPVTLGDYKSLKATAETVTVTAADVTEVVDRIRDGLAEKSTLKRAAKVGDDVTIDFVGKKDGVAFDGGSATDYTLKLGSNQFIPGFEEGVLGHKAGDSFDLDLTFPADYHAKDLKGAAVTFSVVLKEVSEKKLPEVTDEFAAKVGPFTTAKEMKADIKKELTAQRQREADEKRKDALVRELVEKSKLAVPEILVKDQERSIEQDFMQNLAYQGLSLDSYLESQGFATKEVWLDTEVNPAAVNRVKAGLVLAELTKVLKIDASPEEVAEHIATYRQQYANNAETLKRFDEPEVQRDIANRLLTEKTVDALVSLNTK